MEDLNVNEIVDVIKEATNNLSTFGGATFKVYGVEYVVEVKPRHLHGLGEFNLFTIKYLYDFYYKEVTLSELKAMSRTGSYLASIRTKFNKEGEPTHLLTDVNKINVREFKVVLESIITKDLETLRGEESDYQ